MNPCIHFSGGTGHRLKILIGIGIVGIVFAFTAGPLICETVVSASAQRYDDQLEKKHSLLGCMKEDVGGLEAGMQAQLTKGTVGKELVLSAKDIEKLMPQMPQITVRMTPMAGTLSPESSFKTNIAPAVKKAPDKK